MQFVPAGSRTAQGYRRLLYQSLDPLPGSAASAILINDLLQVLAHHVVDGGLALGRHCASRLE